MNDNDESLLQVFTHVADENCGRLSGLDLARVKWVVLALVIGLLPGFALLESFGLGWASIAMFGPAVLVALFQLLFLQDRPPGWLLSWVETRLTGAHLSLLNRPWL